MRAGFDATRDGFRGVHSALRVLVQHAMQPRSPRPREPALSGLLPPEPGKGEDGIALVLQTALDTLEHGAVKTTHEVRFFRPTDRCASVRFWVEARAMRALLAPCELLCSWEASGESAVRLGDDKDETVGEVLARVGTPAKRAAYITLQFTKATT